VKTGLVIEALLRRQLRVVYVPIDVSASALAGADERLSAEFPCIQVRPQVADFTDPNYSLAGMVSQAGPKLVLFIGSSIGNFEPADARALLSRLRENLKRGDALLLGTDLVKDPSILVPAYDDSCGVTAEFNKNVLARINHELGADFDLDAFRHVAHWNGSESRMEMYLESTRRQQAEIVTIGIRVSLELGERIHTENSCKYTAGSVLALLEASGFRPERMWTDDHRWYAVHLARAV
jgi:dimethylhistidine N-methyltransferase